MKQIFLLFFSFFLLSSCTEEEKPGYSGDGIPVTFSLSGIGTAGSASAASRTAGAPLPDGATVRVLAYRRAGSGMAADLSAANYAGEATYQVSGGGTALTPCTVDDTGVVTAASGQPMQLLVGAYDFFTVTPALAADHTGEAPVVTVANGVDYASSVTENRVIDPAGETRGQTVTLEKLNRQCARLNFTIQCDATVNTLTGIEVEELKLAGLSDTPLKTAATTEQAGILLPSGNSILTLNGTDLPTDAANAKLAQGAVIVLPKADAAFGVSMQLCLNGSILPTVFDEVEVPAMPFEAGREYPVTITLSHGGAVTLSIGSARLWQDGGDQNQNAGLLPGITVGMPDWTLDEQAHGLGTIPNLSRNGTANCYIVTAAGYYGFDATKPGNDSNVSGITKPTDLTTATEARVLWQTDGTTSVVKDVKLQNGKVIFTTGTATEGNAVIGIFASNANNAPCLWSWHIWRLPSAPGTKTFNKTSATTGGTVAVTMMDRNLGAYNNNTNDVKAIGLLYQWGRKDPFPGPAGFNETEPGNIYGSLYAGGAVKTFNGAYTIPAVKSDATTGTINYGIQYPGAFIYQGPNDDWLQTKDNNLWGTPWQDGGTGGYNKNQGTKSIYDPCPPGYRVPPQDTWSLQTTAGAWSNGMTMDKLGSFWFPAAGIRWGDSDAGKLARGGTYGYYWSSSPYGGTNVGAGYLGFLSGNIRARDYYYRAHGCSVRCVSE